MQDNWIKAWNKESNKLLKYLHGNECLPANFDEVVVSFTKKVKKDAIEKTNKRWRERIAIALARPVERKPGGTIHELNYDAIYDLLEDKK